MRTDVPITLLLLWCVLGPVVVALSLVLMWPGTFVMLLVVVLTASMALHTFHHVSPVGFARCVGHPTRSWIVRARFQRIWPQLCDARQLRVHDGRPAKIKSRWPRLEIVMHPGVGDTIETYQECAEALRTAMDATQVRVEPSGRARVSLLLSFGDELTAPFAACAALNNEDLRYVSMGRRSDGRSWRLPIGPHTLVAGSSGAGKGSVFWSFVFGVAPAVREGRVQLHGIDLKGGMEILMGESFFTTRATTPAEAVATLEFLVAGLHERASRYAGRIRSHQATTEEPLHVVMVDELAALTAYSSDRDLQRRGEAALNLLCSQGRAVGYMVFACLQDPRKEVIPSRGLFTQMVGLRLKDLSETTMVLGELAAQSGAHCHRITRDVPGTGFVVPEEGGHPIRVRAGFASDAEIRRVAAEHPSPVRVTPLHRVSEPVPGPNAQRGRRRP